MILEGTAVACFASIPANENAIRFDSTLHFDQWANTTPFLETFAVGLFSSPPTTPELKTLRKTRREI
jgi:hypothetical protein